jgi:hypothetical protein
MAEGGSDDEYTVPLAYPAPYGAGLKKKGIKFVSAGTLPSPSNAQAQSGDDIANSYLALVLDKPPPPPEPTSPAEGASQNEQVQVETVAKCQTCNLPLKDAEGVEHHTSLAHQVSLTHIYPPNAIDRTRKGFAYLKEQGWDPDSRRGLGLQGEGILRPVQAKEKKDKAGIGDRSISSTPGNGTAAKVQKGPQGLDPKALKKLEQQRNKRGKRLHEMFYTNDEVAKYMGESG